MPVDVRPAHELKLLSSGTMPQYLVFVDTETLPEPTGTGGTVQRFRLGVAIFLRLRRDGKPNNRETIRFTSRDVFWSYVLKRTSPKGVLYVIAHNQRFDAPVLLAHEFLTGAGYEPEFIAATGEVFIAKWRRDGRTIVLLDNLNWFKGKLDRWGLEMGLGKLEMPDWGASDEEWFTYCERDTEILYELFLWYVDFLRSHDLGKWQYTIASSAMTAFRHRFMSHRVYIPDERADTDLSRAAYHGGRTSVFRLGAFEGGPFYKVDVNSMYPHVMREYNYPVCLEGRYECVPVPKLLDTMKAHNVIARVTVEVPDPFFVYEWDGRNTYPVGRFVATLTTEELKYAARLGEILEVHDVAVYRSRPLFRAYVDAFYAIKLEADREGKRLLRSFAKLYLNSLYGKFGQRGYVDEVIGYDEEFRFRAEAAYDIVSGEHYMYRQIGHKVIRTSKGGEAFNSFCAIAAHVTANARLLLYDAVLTVGRDHCFYCDTDSLIVDSLGLRRLSGSMDDERLGAWKLEAEVNEIEIVAPKHYRMAGEWKRKGIRQSAEQVGPNTFRQELWPGYDQYLNNGGGPYVVKTIVKRLVPELVDGYADAMGYVHPYVMSGETVDAQPELPF